MPQLKIQIQCLANNADPVPVNDMQEYMLGELIKGSGLDPVTCLNCASAADFTAGATSGNAQALAMALALRKKNVTLNPRSEKT